MKVLQFFYENHPKFEANCNRKLEIPKGKILIKGPKHCGKKTLIFHFLSQFKNDEILFIDANDVRFEFSSLLNLEAFLNTHEKIKILCICNITFIPNLDKIHLPIILSTHHANLNIAQFKNLELDFFDFEEFIINKNLPINHLTGLFLQMGRSKFSEKNALLKQDFCELELEILKYFALNLGQQISISKMFLELKNKLKTSKDSVYQSVKNLENTFVIKTLNHNEKRLQKIYFRDFAMKNALCIRKDFNALFENLIFNELFKLKKEFFYNKFFHFCNKELQSAYIASATLDLDLIKIRAKKILPKALELGIFHIFFITLSNEDIFFEKGVKFEALPFDKWALSF